MGSDGSRGSWWRVKGCSWCNSYLGGRSGSRSITWALEARRCGRVLSHGPTYRQPRGLVGCYAIRWRYSRLGWKPLGSER